MQPPKDISQALLEHLKRQSKSYPGLGSAGPDCSTNLLGNFMNSCSKCKMFFSQGKQVIKTDLKNYSFSHNHGSGKWQTIWKVTILLEGPIFDFHDYGRKYTSSRACLPMGCSQWATGICHQSAKPLVLALVLKGLPYVPLHHSRKVVKKQKQKIKISKHKSQGWCIANHHFEGHSSPNGGHEMAFHWSWDPHMLLMTRAAARPDNWKQKETYTTNDNQLNQQIFANANLFGYS